jgi:release factor glutamine methyltransferase
VNVWEALQQGRSLLAQVSDEGDIEAEMLLRECLSLDRTRLYARLGEDLSTEQEEAYRGLIVRRMVYEPAAYILGHKEFFGLDFEVTPAAIIPRPETERLVEIAIEFLQRQPDQDGLQISDVGTGSGIIAVSIAHAVPKASVVAVDLSADALALAQRNAERHRVQRRIRFVQGDLVEPLDGAAFGLIAANLPYVRTSEWEQLPREIREHEPREGLDGGPDGLQVITRLLQQAPAHLAPGGLLLAEIDERQGWATADMAREGFPSASVEVRRDLSGRDRVLTVQT